MLFKYQDISIEIERVVGRKKSLKLLNWHMYVKDSSFEFSCGILHLASSSHTQLDKKKIIIR